MTLLSFTFPLASQAVFDKTIARDWYDGLTSGIAKSSRLGIAFCFDILAWGPAQEPRIFALSSLDVDAFDMIAELLQGNVAANWPVWFPEWPIWKSEQTAQASEIRRLLAKGGRPEYVIASDSMFTTLLAARLLDPPSIERLPTTFEETPADDEFPYWSEFLRLPK